MDIDQRRELVSKFLRRCVTYSDASIERKEGRGEDSDEIQKWKNYREFTAYSAAEVESGELDSWLEDGSSASLQARPDLSGDIETIHLGELDHFSRREWLAALLMPRPVVLLATNRDGINNLAPMSSISIVSNSPPLLCLSLSKNLEGRERDSLVNLREGGVGSNCRIMSLNPDYKSVDAVEAAKMPIAPDESEYDLIQSSVLKDESNPLLSFAAASLDCTLVELQPLPEGASATLAILRVDSITKMSSATPTSFTEKLMQIDFESLGSSALPNDWRYDLSMD